MSQSNPISNSFGSGPVGGPVGGEDSASAHQRSLPKNETHWDSVPGILKRYAGLTVGGVAVACANFESAEAALVFTAPDLWIDPESNPINGRVDLNGDGLAEFGVVVGTASAPDEKGNVGMMHGGGLFGAEIAFSGRYPIAFQASQLIGASLSFRTAIGTFAFSSAGLLGGRGGWFAGADAYIGARFQTWEGYFYGWIHAVWNPSNNTLIIDSAAYEDSGASALITKDQPDNFRLSWEADSVPGRVDLSWPALAGKTYKLQRTTDLEHWETIHVVTPLRDCAESFLDDEYVGDPPSHLFYRVEQSQSSLLLLALGVPRRMRKRDKGSVTN